MRGRRLRRDAQCVLDHPGPRAAVRHDAHSADAEQRRASIALVVEAMLHAVESRLQREQGQRRDRAHLQIGAQGAEDVAGQPLEELDHHVAHEPVADNHVGDVLDQVVALHVPHEVEVQLAQAAVGLTCQRVPLLLLLTDVQQADAWARTDAGRRG